MFPSEYVCEIKEPYEHFNLYYKILSQNAVIGCPEKNWDEGISSALEKASRPFVWYVDENANPEFKEKLKARGFRDSGLFQGVMGSLSDQIAIPQAPLGCQMELVTDEKTMEAFNELVCSTIGVTGDGKAAYKKALWDSAHGPHPLLFHWVARKDGKVVSALTTLVDGDAVSFWNGATDPDYRCHGINTALRCLAIKDAVSKGCHIGISYLMGDGMAFGICKKLGFETKWRFHAFQSPVEKP